jgi:broad specificity phosphatase PhoE
MEILFVRHAEKNETIENGGLTKRGIEQTKNLIKFLKNEKFDEFYCSDMLRAKETAELISKEINLKPSINKSLNEFSVKILKEDKWDKELLDKYKDLKKFLDSFTKRANLKKRVLIVAHGNTNRLILSLLLELELKNLIRFRQLETAINEVYWSEKFNNWRLKYWNYTSHQPKKLIEGKDKF